VAEKIRDPSLCSGNTFTVATKTILPAFQARYAKRPRGPRALARAIGRLNAATFEGLIDKLGDEDLIADLYASRSSRFDIHTVEVDEAAKRVTYSVRGCRNSKSVGFKRLREIWSSPN
jgi:hypothetical protein